MPVTLKGGRIVLTLGAIVALLTLADVIVLWIKFRWHHDSVYGLGPLFDFNKEGNLPSFYSACALLFAAVLLFLIADDARARGDRWRRHWLALGIVFVFLAIDEAAELHGLLSQPLRDLTKASGAFLYAWVIPYGVLTLLFAAAYREFFFALPKKQRVLFGVAGIVYVAGALGMEMVGGVIVTARGGPDLGLEHWSHAVSYTLEELLEMVGVLILIHALLGYLAERRVRVLMDIVK